MNDLHELETLLLSRIPLIIIETRDEKRVTSLFARLAVSMAQPVMAWSATTGLQRVDIKTVPQRHNSEPQQVLGQIKATVKPAVYLLLDFHPYLNDPLNVRMLKEIALEYDTVGHTLVLVSHALKLPPELDSFGVRFELSLPDRQALGRIFDEETRRWEGSGGRKVNTDLAALERIIGGLRGATDIDARRIIAGIIHDDGRISDADFERVTRARYRLLESNGALSCEYETGSFADVGGLANLKRWIELRRTAFIDNDAGGDAPRGILLVGVQGGGKSLAARTVAGVWGLPLLRLDFGALYNKYHGESERNLRESLAAAEAMSPCVLWIDEIEKAIGTSDNDGGTSRRILGSLLTWMAERKQPVFVVATANVIEELPPELVRKGRLDEIFFVDLPDAATRADIFAIHLNKRDHAPECFQLERLADNSDGFSGAEIEQAIVAASYLARSHGTELVTSHILTELGQTRPLSTVMAEKIGRLRAWARERTVPAN